MLAAYYSYGCNSRHLFSGLQIESDKSYKTHLNQYDVIYLNMQQFLIEAAPEKATEYLEQEVLGELWQQNDIHTFKTKDDVLTLLIHLGYLGYDPKTRETFIPNKEIIEEFENAMSVGGWTEIMRILNASEKLLESTLPCDEESVAAGLDLAHSEVSSILTYNDENSLSCAIGLAYYSARKDYRMIRELPSGHGFADIVFLPLPSSPKPALVVELKYDQSAAAAIRQIKDRH